MLSFLAEPAIFQVLSNHLWLVNLVMVRADVDSFHRCRKFVWTTRVQRKRWREHLAWRGEDGPSVCRVSGSLKQPVY